MIGLDQELSQVQNSGQYRVLDTLPGGPAARAGVVTGDALVSINGMAQPQLDGPSIQALLLQAAGTHLALQLRDAQGRPKSAIIILEDLI